MRYSESAHQKATGSIYGENICDIKCKTGHPNRHTLEGTAYFNALSDGYIVGEFNDIPCQKTDDKGHYGPGNHGNRLSGLDEGSIRFCVAPVLVCTWLHKTYVAYPLLSEQPDNAVTFPLISWNGDG